MNFDILDKTICLVGKRGSGKSQLLKYIIRMNKHLFKKVFLVCPTECVNGFFSDTIPPNCIFEKYDEDWMTSLIEKMTKHSKGKNKDDADRVLLVLDDCIADVKFHYSDTFKKIFVRARHIYITIILTSQYLNSIPPIARNNLDYLLVNKINAKSLDILEEEFNIGMPKKEFIDMFKKTTGNYKFLIINNCSSGYNDNYDELFGSIKVPDKYVK